MSSDSVDEAPAAADAAVEAASPQAQPPEAERSELGAETAESVPEPEPSEPEPSVPRAESEAEPAPEPEPDTEELYPSGDSNSVPSADLSGDPNGDPGADDEFGGFDEFGEFESGAEAASADAGLVDAVQASSLADAAADAPRVQVLRAAEIGPGVEAAVQALLAAPPAASSAPAGDGSTSTSQQLWQVLTEPSWVPVPDWSGSRIHKRLAVSLGVPLNLDESLPKVVTRRMVLPTTSEDDVEGMQKVPEWSLLALVSPEALQSMTADELRAHTATLAAALAAADELKDAMESQEMDLLGEKNILEGMVESLLAYSQRNQREGLLRKASKSKR